MKSFVMLVCLMSVGSVAFADLADIQQRMYEEQRDHQIEMAAKIERDREALEQQAQMRQQESIMSLYSNKGSFNGGGY